MFTPNDVPLFGITHPLGLPRPVDCENIFGAKIEFFSRNAMPVPYGSLGHFDTAVYRPYVRRLAAFLARREPGWSDAGVLIAAPVLPFPQREACGSSGRTRGPAAAASARITRRDAFASRPMPHARAAPSAPGHPHADSRGRRVGEVFGGRSRASLGRRVHALTRLAGHFPGPGAPRILGGCQGLTC